MVPQLLRNGGFVAIAAASLLHCAGDGDPNGGAASTLTPTTEPTEPGTFEPGGPAPSNTEPAAGAAGMSAQSPSATGTSPLPAGEGGSAGSTAEAGAGGTPPAAGSGGIGGFGGASMAGAAPVAGTGGMGAGGAGDEENDLPEMLSQTGLYTERGADGELVLAEGVRPFEPRYKLWSDGADKRRYVYLPPGTQIDTSDPDHWVLPTGTKLWKSFISDGRLVETRLIERKGDGVNDWEYATYVWTAADATDATKMKYKNLLLNAFGTTHDVPNGLMCEKCHDGLRDRALGFSALQLNHDLGGVNLATLMDEGLLTDPISLDIGMPGDDELTRDALGYLHANCGNCHNDSPGLPLQSVPEPQMFLRASVNDLTLEDTAFYATALNQPTTNSGEISVPYRVRGGVIEESAVHVRMTFRMFEEQMPPIGTEVTDDEALMMLQTWIESLPPLEE